MNVAEVFYSIQGEGTLTGMPSGFIRFSGCNLRCTWCDTKYASWFPEKEPWTLDTILAEVEKYKTRYIVITGGEPTIHKELPELTRRLKAQGKHITIETNGITYVEGTTCDLMSLSPKLSHSVADQIEFPQQAKLQAEKRLNIPAFRDWVDNYDYQFKFVVCSKDDVSEIQELVKMIDRDIPAERIFLSPEGVDSEQIQRISQEVVAACQEHGYRYCSRLHIDLFGNTRGT